MLRLAIRKEHKLQMSYIDVKGDDFQRIIWPLALGFFEEAHVVDAWCEIRQDYRHFRTDRIVKLTSLGTRYPERRQQLLRKWRKIHNIPEQ